MRVIPLSAVALIVAGPLVAQGTGVDLRLGGVAMATSRAAELAGATGTASGTMMGAEMSLRRGGLGVMARVLDGKLTAGSGSPAAAEITDAEAGLLLGVPSFAVEGGYVRRAITGSFATSVYSFYKVGARLGIEIGATGVSATVAAAAYFKAGNQDGDGKVAETSLRYAPHGFPIYVSIGYRLEQITLKSSAGDRPDELRGILLCAGVRLAR
jgi:hypothetical protein